jgi:4-hydroxy-tetrahydrodipicolinate synthase
MSAADNCAARGIYSVLPTPFDSDEALDLPALARIVGDTIAAGVDGLTVLGVTGEAHKLNAAERRAVLETVAETTAGRVPFIVGVSLNGAGPTIEAAAEAERAGASGVMVAPPTFTGAGPQLTDYVRRVAGGTKLPLTFQDYPLINGVKLALGELIALVQAVPEIVTVKLEDTPSGRRTAGLLAGVDRPLTVLGGLSAVYLIDELEHGSAGSMTGFPVPEALVELWSKWRSGDEDGARAVYRRWLSLFVLDGQPGLGVAVRKHVWMRRGALTSPGLRAPGLALSAQEADRVDAELAVAGAPLLQM